MPDKIVELVLTDPPWDKAATTIYDFLGLTTARVLDDGGFCAIYTGANFIPSVLHSFAPSGLTYSWTMAVLQLNSDLRYFKYKVHSRWRPIMMFVKGKSQFNKWLPDTVRSTRCKRNHVWQEGIEPSVLLVDRLVRLSHIVLDPCLGSGTSCIAAKKLGRKCIGIEIEEKYCEIAAKRCSQDVMSLNV